MAEISSRVDFNIIRYANCWEDADVLLDALQLPANKKIFCIASAGDNALSLLTTNPSIIVAADISKPQLYLTALKRAAFENLDYEELLAFLGVRNSNNSLQLYEKVSRSLSAEEKNYWDTYSEVIKKGVIHCGKFETYFSKFRKYMLPLVHSQKDVQELLATKSTTQQSAHFQQKWNTLRWKMLMGIFFSKYVMGKYGRDPEFLKHVNISVPSFIRRKAEAHLSSIYCQDNYMLRMIFTGSFDNTLPHYLRREHFETIRNNLSKLQLVHAGADEVITQQPFDAYYFSNIFEYIAANEFEKLASEWSNYIPKNARLAYWNLMAPRSFSETASDSYIYDAKSQTYEQTDKGFFYSRFLLEHKK